MPPAFRILHVDDDPDIVEIAAEYLERVDDRLSVSTETDPATAIERVEAEPVDCVVSDYRMPRLDGLDLLDAVRDEHPDLPVILFTSESSEKIASEAIRAGVTDYLHKEYRRDQFELLANRITNAVTRYRTKARHERTHRALETATEGIAILDAEGCYDYLNRAYAELYGYSPDELRGEHWAVLYPDEGVRRFEEEILPELRSAGSWTGRSRGLAADGSTVVERLSLTTLDDGGHVRVVRDVTDRVERERELQRERDRARTLFRNVSIPIVYYEYEDGRPIAEEVNAAFEETFGYTEAEISGEVFDEYVVPDEYEREGLEINERVMDGEVVDAEVERLAADGRRKFNLLSVPLRPGETGERGFAIYADVTERRRYRSALEALHEFGTTIQDDPSVEAVCERTVAAAARILDFHVCGVLLREGDRLVPCASSEEAPDDEVLSMGVDQGLAGETYRTGESRVVDDLAEHDIAEPSEKSYRSGISIPVGDHGVFQAISEQKGFFDEDDRELAELLVSHTASALDHLDRERRLRCQNERLDEFAGIVSHDLRNPIEVARANVELARGDHDSEHLAEVENALDRMTVIIEDTLTLAQQGETVGERTIVGLAEVTERCWGRIDSTGGDLAVVENVAFEADADRIDSAFENLFSNAVEHGSTGPDDVVTVRVGALDDADGFYVEDDGPGIPPELRENVFDQGYTTVGSGTGLGLSIVERIVDAHGWAVRITDGRDGGARFEVTGVDVVE